MKFRFNDDEYLYSSLVDLLICEDIYTFEDLEDLIDDCYGSPKDGPVNATWFELLDAYLSDTDKRFWVQDECERVAEDMMYDFDFYFEKSDDGLYFHDFGGDNPYIRRIVWAIPEEGDDEYE